MVQNLKQNHPGSVEARIDKLVDGLAKLPAGTPLNVVGTSYVPSSLSAALTAKKAPYVKAGDAHTALAQAVADRDAQNADTLAFLDAIEGALVGGLGATSPQLKDCGVTPKKPHRTMTPEKRLARAQKARATRAAKKAAQANAPKPAPDQGGTKAS